MVFSDIAKGNVITGAKPKSTVFFNGRSSFINFGSHSSIDNMNAGDFTVECWHRPLPVYSGSINNMFDKNGGGERYGWGFEVYENSYLYGFVPMPSFENPHNAMDMGRAPTFTTGSWIHMAMVFNAATNVVRCVFNSTWGTQFWNLQTGQGPAISDTGVPLFMGCYASFRKLNWTRGDFAWVRFSNIIRYPVGVPYQIPSLLRPPLPDENTIEQWNFDEGVGKVTHALINPSNDSKEMANVTWTDVYRNIGGL